MTVDLAPGDVATCTYVDSRDVTDLSLYKQTTGGTGGPFHFRVQAPGGAVTGLSASTTGEDTPVEAGTVHDTALGAYTITEELPSADAAGHWSVSAFDCNGTPGPVTTTQVVHVTAAAQPFECTFTNHFTPDGGLTVTKTTVGEIGTTDFVVTPLTDADPSAAPAGDTSDPVLRATTAESGLAVPATQVSGAPLNPLPMGRYSIVEEGPADTSSGTWAPVSISCNGSQSDPSSSATIVDITEADPHVTCAFTNAFTALTSPTSTTTTSSTVTPVVPPVPSGPGAQAASSTSPGAPGPGLAMTGSDVAVPLGVALALAVAGLVLLAVDRVRRGRLVPPLAEDDPPH